MAKRKSSESERATIMGKYNNHADCGRYGKVADVLVRYDVSPTSKVNHCKQLGKVDILKFFEDRMLKVEVKSGCGKMAYNAYCTKDNVRDYPRENYFAGIDYIVYIPECYGNDEIDYATESWVFTRNEFLDFILNYSTKTGKSAPMIKANGEHINIQSFNSNVKQTYLWETLDTMPNLGEWIEQFNQQQSKGKVAGMPPCHHKIKLWKEVNKMENKAAMMWVDYMTFLYNNGMDRIARVSVDNETVTMFWSVDIIATFYNDRVTIVKFNAIVKSYKYDDYRHDIGELYEIIFTDMTRTILQTIANETRRAIAFFLYMYIHV